MRVRYTLEAIGHIGAIYAYIEARNPEAARRVIARIRATAEQLGEFPHVGHYGLVAGTRELAVRGLPYIIVHELHVDEVVVIGVFHGAQDREDGA